MVRVPCKLVSGLYNIRLTRLAITPQSVDASAGNPSRDLPLYSCIVQKHAEDFGERN